MIMVVMTMTMMIRNLGFIGSHMKFSLITFKLRSNLGSQVISCSRERQMLFDLPYK